MNLLGTFQPILPIISCNPFCYYLMVLDWHCIDTIENLKKTCINFIPCCARTISSFRQTIIFFGAISIHCGGHHPVSVMVNNLFLKYTSCCCCCSTWPLRNIPPVATHLKNIHRPCQPYSLSACHLSMLHHHGLARTALCLSKILVAKTAYHDPYLTSGSSPPL